MEKCNWKCKHSKCTKLCSEPCDRQLCDHPDKRKLKCGHPSIGVCGERMPKLCRICDQNTVQEIFFGNEDEEDARFILLEDCNHTIEVTGLINWMNAEPDSTESNPGRSSIQLKKCPKCKTEIRHTKALNTFIQASLRDVQQVKLLTYGNLRENRALQRFLNEKTNRILDNGLFRNNVIHLSGIYAGIMHKTKFEERSFNPEPKQILIELENKLRLVEKLQQICLLFDGRNQKENNICEKAIAMFIERIEMASVFIKEYKNSDQSRHDIEREVSFLLIMAKAIVESCKKPFNDTAKKLLNDAFELAHKYGSATENVRNEFKKIVTEAFKQATGLAISIDEKDMILKAINLQRGHWYKCRCGFIYCIGECGGAMQRSNCPECKETIGGANHSLVQGNELATEMDGATQPAWPTNLMEQLQPFMD